MNKKKGKAMSNEMYIALGSLIIALIGGVPGIIAIMSYYKERNQLIWLHTGTAILNGKDVRDGSDIYWMIITGHVTNKGQRPIYPIVFDLSYQLGGRMIKLERKLIPAEDHFQALVSQSLKTDEPLYKNDLQMGRFELSQSRPQYGHLMFRVSKAVYDDYQKPKISKFRLECKDTVNNTHVCHFQFSIKDHRTDTMYGRQGLRILPQDDKLEE